MPPTAFTKLSFTGKGIKLKSKMSGDMKGCKGTTKPCFRAKREILLFMPVPIENATARHYLDWNLLITQWFSAESWSLSNYCHPATRPQTYEKKFTCQDLALFNWHFAFFLLIQIKIFNQSITFSHMTHGLCVWDGVKVSVCLSGEERGEGSNSMNCPNVSFRHVLDTTRILLPRRIMSLFW